MECKTSRICNKLTYSQNNTKPNINVLEIEI